MSALQEQAIRQHCKALRTPTIGSQFARLAEAAAREGQMRIPLIVNGHSSRS